MISTRQRVAGFAALALIATAIGGATADAATKKTTKKTTKKVTATTAAPTTAAPSTAAPTTAAPTSAAPTTKAASGTAKQGDTMTIAMGAAPSTLDPAKSPIQPQQTWLAAMAYEPFVRLNADLSYSPGLAESWKFDGLNETLTFTLRSGLKFADGTALDAKAAAASIDYWRKNSPASGSQGSSIDTVTATGPLTIVVKQKNPNPNILRVFSTNFMAGSLISAAGLADPSKIASGTYGAGPYVLDAGATVSGSTYTFVPNKNFYDQNLVNWKKVVFRVIPDLNARLQSVQTGQADMAQVDGTVYGAAKAAGLEVSVGASNATFGILLADRTGELSKPLADVDVRRALNYAIDRPAICKAALGEAGGDPTNNYPTVDYDASLDKLYAYNENKAKQMLADAGYPNGFKLSVESTATPPFSTIGQAVAGYWKKIGVDVQFTTNPSIPASQTAQRAKQFPAYVYGYGTLPSINVGVSFLDGTVNTFNPWGVVTDAQVKDLLNQAPVLPIAEAAKVYKKAFAIAVDKAFNVNVCTFNVVSVANKKVDGWQNPKSGTPPYPNQFVPA